MRKFTSATTGWLMGMLLLFIGQSYAQNYTLQLFHASDLEGGVDAIDNAPNFAAIIDGLEEEQNNTLILSGGDNWIPGAFFNAAGNRDLRSVFQNVYQELFANDELTNIREASGRVDISIMNIIGFDASAVGNHEFDAGTNTYEEIIRPDIRGNTFDDIRWLGSQFPYLSANLDFSGDGNLSGIYTSEILPVGAFATNPENYLEAGNAPKIAPAVIVERGGEQIGIVGATTQILESITSNGGVQVIGEQEDDMEALAAILQPVIDSITAQGINKVVLVTHLQLIDNEKELISLLSGVDIVVAGGSDVLMAQEDDVLRAGDEADESYPFITQNADSDPAVVVGTDGEYSYVGRLIVEFDENGILVESSLANEANGAYASIDEVVSTVWGLDDPFEEGTKGELVQRLTTAISDIVTTLDGIVFGQTDVYLEGRREFVRTEETNLGNLTADANLWLAKSVDSSVTVSIKNGGGIRAAIGQISDNGDGTASLNPTVANPEAGKEAGEVSQLDIENTLRFNNGLTLLTLTASQLKDILEHGVAQTEGDNQPGRFPQVGGIRFSFDPRLPVNERVTSIDIIDENDELVEVVLEDGVFADDSLKTYRIVTLDFLAGGGDSYPFDTYENTDPVDLADVILEEGSSNAAPAGSEQDALAEYILEFFSETPFAKEETPITQDNRINNLEAKDLENQGSEPFTLQLLHASDLEGGVDAIDNAPNFAAIIDGLEEEFDNTVVISGGDNFIPGPFFNAASDFEVRGLLQSVYQEFYGLPGLDNIREARGRIDMAIMNIIGFDASAVGNHEFDAGTDPLSDIIGTDIRGSELGDVRWLGSQFPYLSANLDFSGDGSIGGFFTSEILPNTAFQSLPTDLSAAAAAPKLAPATTIERNGELIGVIGASTQILEDITSVGGVEVVGPKENDMAALAGILQPIIDGMIEEGINKIIVTTHLQQIDLEKELATLLSGVDIIVAGGSDVLMAQEDDELREGDEAEESYPFVAQNADGDPVVVVGTDGEYTYVGRLIVTFDESGVLDTTTFANEMNGAYASIESVVNGVWGEDSAFAAGTKGTLVSTLTEGVSDIVLAKDGNIVGRTDVFLDGRRSQVRTEETNLGNLTADANLWTAQQFDTTVLVSIKNGGGIRAEIGEPVEITPGVFEFGPPQGNPEAGKEVGDVSQLDLENTLRFNNGLSLLSLTATQLKEVIEHGVAETEEGATPGRFPQVGGMKFSYDMTQDPGSRVQSLMIMDLEGTVLDTVVFEGEIAGDTERLIRIVTLDFLAGGGDGYPYDTYDSAQVSRVDLEDVLTEEGAHTFADAGSEQDAIAEYMTAFFLDTPFAVEETSIEEDTRIINLGPGPFTLQLLHASDLEGGVDAIDNAPNFAAIIDGLEEEFDNTVVISGGDNFIPGPFFNAASDFEVRGLLQSVYQEFYGLPGLDNIREARGRIDMAIMNIIGFDASAVGNHEFDAGTDPLSDIIGTDIRGSELGDVRWLGSQFPYLSANLDFSGDGSIGGFFTSEILPNTAFQSLPTDLSAAAAAPKLAPATTIERNGELIGVIGASTQILEDITSVGGVEVVGPKENDMAALAGILQPIIDGMIEEGINKIIVTTHLQQIDLEKELATLLSGVDIIVAGGSDVLMAQEDDELREGDEAEESYPFVAQNADGDPVVVVGTDGEYTYVGRLIVTFDESGVLDTTTFANEMNGAYASIESVVNGVWGEDSAFAAGTKGTLVSTLTEGVSDIVLAKDGNIVGRTDVFLDGRRSQVRTEETNLGNLTADANLWTAQQFDTTVLVSIKNGGGIRAEIGEPVEITPGVFEFGPPQGNPEAGKEVGDVSQLDLENTLRFNNGLSLLSLTATQLKEVIEHGVAETEEGATPGRFPQVGGMKFSYDMTQDPGSRVQSLMIMDLEGTVLDTVVFEGEIAGDTERLIRIVTLDFLAGGGDGYPYDTYDSAQVSRVDLEDVLTEEGAHTFADAGSEQDAIAEYMTAFFLDTPFAVEETSIEEDTRIVNIQAVIPVSIRNEFGEVITMNLYPNPVQDGNVMISFNGLQQKAVELSMFNMLGQQWNFGTVRPRGDQSEVELNFAKLELNAGVYYLRATLDGKEIAITKFLIK